jgi:hypothetical protein
MVNCYWLLVIGYWFKQQTKNPYPTNNKQQVTLLYQLIKGKNYDFTLINVTD